GRVISNNSQIPDNMAALIPELKLRRFTARHTATQNSIYQISSNSKTPISPIAAAIFTPENNIIRNNNNVVNTYINRNLNINFISKSLRVENPDVTSILMVPRSFSEEITL